MCIKVFRKSTLKVFLCIGGLAGIFVSSCNDDFIVKVKKHDIGDRVTVNMPQRKILYLIVDGLRGRIIPQINPPAMLKMTDNSIYTFDGLSDKNGKEVTNWTNMLTGVMPDKHKVVSSDFSGSDLEEYPMFFTRLKAANSSWQTAAFSSSALLSEHLINDADVNKTFDGNDRAVKDAIVNELQDNPDATVVLGEFHSVEEAGEQYGYDSSSAQYVNAIMKVDSYIGDILETLKQRTNYSQENWLVVVASDKGGMAAIPPDQADNTVFGNPVRNNFIIFYNPRFSSRIVSKPNVANIPYEGYTIMLQGKDENAVKAFVPADSAAIYNFGTSGEYTVQIKVKVFDFGTTWPSFFGKKASTLTYSSSSGWGFMFHGDENWRVIFDYATSMPLQNFPDSTWHTLTLKIYEEDGRRLAIMYTDGNKGNPFDITGIDLDNNEPLTAGYFDGWTSTQPELYITDIKIWKAALPDNFIAANGGKVGLDPSSPYYDDVIGYWPGTDGTGDRFKDYSSYHNDMFFNITPDNKNKYGWEHFSDLSGLIFPPLPENLEETVPRGVDIPYMIYKWMGVDASSWDLDGKFWLPGYVDVK